MMETFILEDAKTAQLGDDLAGGTQLLGADGVTYRVVQVSGSDGAAVVTTEAGTAVQVVGGTNGVFQTSTPVADTSTPSAPFYVMMSATPTENAAVITGAPQRLIVPSKIAPTNLTTSPSTQRVTKTVARDERRRATHNEVERRRRDKINLWILRLSRIIPDCSLNGEAQQANKNQSLQSKGIILSKACDYIAELKEKADKGAQLAKEHERLQAEMSELRAKYETATQEIQILKDALSQSGIQVSIFRDTSGSSGDQQQHRRSSTPTRAAASSSYDDGVLDE